MKDEGVVLKLIGSQTTAIIVSLEGAHKSKELAITNVLLLQWHVIISIFAFIANFSRPFRPKYSHRSELKGYA